MRRRNLFLASSVLIAGAAAAAMLCIIGDLSHANAGPEAPTAELRVCPSGCAYSSVQAAVDDANPGDVIKVAQGTYSDVHARDTVTQVVYISKTVTLRGGYTRSNWQTADPTAHPTTLDAQRQGRVLYVARGIDPAIEGLRLTGGDAAGLGGEPGLEYDTGGGVYIYRSAPRLTYNWILSNTAQRGGGLYSYEDEAILQSNMILSNTTSHLGGGLYLDSSEGTLIANRIAGNRAGSYGGGLGVWAGDPALLGNVIAGNQAESHGGGLYLQRYDGSVRRNLLTRNESGSWGGGIIVLDGDPQLEGNRLIDNSAAEGGGLCVHGTAVTLTNHVIVGNYASTQGSALRIRESSGLQLLHTTIASNSGGDGSGV
ncbi:MAG: right-handed parallel beta-helix repeat-containing protein, partial [Anaerolineae bacterium]